jgi:hypothetical protein
MEFISAGNWEYQSIANYYRALTNTKKEKLLKNLLESPASRNDSLSYEFA